MSPLISLAVLLLVTLISCKPQKAIELKAAIDQKERTAFNMLAGKSGSEEQELEALVKEDYKGALAFVDQQEREFDKLIGEIAALPADNIKQGNELKAAAMQYYGALKELHLFDRQEIVQQEISSRTKGETSQAAQRKILELSRRKQALFKKVYVSKNAFHQAMQQFNAANGI